MKPVFLDTACFVAILSPRDDAHDRAMRLLPELGRRGVVTTEWVFVELPGFEVLLG